MHCTINVTDVSNGTDTTPTVEILSAVSCSLSILGSCVIFMTNILLPEIRNTTRKLVTCLTIADLFTALGILTAIIVKESSNAYWDDTFCTVQSTVTTFSSLVSFFLTVMIALYLLISVCRPRSGSGMLFFFVANLISWSIPAILIAVALFENMIGRNPEERHTIGTGFWCWIKCKPEDTDKTLLYMFLTGKRIVFRHRSLHDIHEDLREDDQNFLYVWLVLLATRVWGTIRFFIHEVPDYANVSEEIDKMDNILKYIQAVGDPSQAFCNCILFCLLDNVVRTRLFQRMRCKTTPYDRTLINQSINDGDISGVIHIDNANDQRETQEREPLIGRNASFTGYSGIRRSIADAF